MSLIGLASVFVMPILLVVLTYLNYDKLKDKHSIEMKKWGIHMQSIRMERLLTNEKSVVTHALNSHKLSKFSAILAGHICYPRQLVVCLTLVY